MCLYVCVCERDRVGDVESQRDRDGHEIYISII